MKIFEILNPEIELRAKPDISPEAKQWFAGSVVADKAGQPLQVFHGTSAQFDTFYPLTHFGTAVAANQRVHDKSGYGHLIPVYLRIVNPLRVSDAEASDEATLLNAIARGKYPDIDVNTARRQGIRRALRNAGYDGMVYSNRMEHRGRLSWVILDPEQARSAI